MGRAACFLLVATIVGACGTRAATSVTSVTVARPPANEQIYLAPVRGGLSVIGQSGATLRELPRGVPTPDWSAFYVVAPGNMTIVRVLH